MLRRLLVMLLRRSLIFLVLICLGCSAQSAPPDTVKAVERQVRGFYNIPPEVKIIVGAPKPSDFPNYDAVTITFDSGQKKQNYDFLLAKDGKTLLRLTKFDLTKDPYAETMKKIDVKGRPTRGNKDAKVVVVNYDDLQCPFCSHMHQTLFPQMETGCCSSIKISPWSKFIPGQRTPLWMRTAWRLRTMMPIGLSPITFTPTRRR